MNQIKEVLQKLSFFREVVNGMQTDFVLLMVIQIVLKLSEVGKAH